MTWTYAVATRSARNQVRERMADDQPARPLVQNEVIDGFLAESGFDGDATADPTTATAAQIVYAAARAGRVGLGAMARNPDRSVESLSITRARIEAYQAFVETLEAEAGIARAALATMSAGSVSVASDAAILEDTDYARTPFGDDLWGHGGAL